LHHGISIHFAAAAPPPQLPSSLLPPLILLQGRQVLLYLRAIATVQMHATTSEAHRPDVLIRPA
jgi:hypothetical protein